MLLLILLTSSPLLSIPYPLHFIHTSLFDAPGTHRIPSPEEPKLPLLVGSSPGELHAFRPHSFSLRSLLQCHLIREAFTVRPNQNSVIPISPALISISVLFTLCHCLTTLTTTYHIKHRLVYCLSPTEKFVRARSSAILLTAVSATCRTAPGTEGSGNTMHVYAWVSKSLPSLQTQVKLKVTGLGKQAVQLDTHQPQPSSGGALGNPVTLWT